LPGEQTNVLIVGGGSIGERHLRCFLRHEGVRASLCEVRDELRDRLARTYDVSYAEADFERALGCRPEAVVICTPAPLHVPMAIRAVEQGCHVLIEKPLSTRLDRLDELHRLIAAKGVVCGVAYTVRSYGAVRDLRTALRQGRLGEIRQVTVVAGQEFFRFRPAYASTYYADHATGGGAIQDALTHLVDLVDYLIGPARRVCADAAHRALATEKVEDTVHVLARHGDDIPVSYALNQYQAPNEILFTVVGAKGTARLVPSRNSWSFMSAGGDAWQTRYCVPIVRDVPYIDQAGYFLRALRGEDEVTCTLAEGEWALRANLAILRSAFETRGWEDAVPTGGAA